MGEIIETNIKGLGLEKRKESFYIHNTDKSKKHIFSYAKGDEEPIIEISKEFIQKILDYFNQEQPIKILGKIPKRGVSEGIYVIPKK